MRIRDRDRVRDRDRDRVRVGDRVRVRVGVRVKPALFRTPGLGVGLELG